MLHMSDVKLAVTVTDTVESGYSISLNQSYLSLGSLTHNEEGKSTNVDLDNSNEVVQN